jgi:transposase
LGKLEKTAPLSAGAPAADKKKYTTDVQHWGDENDRASGIIGFSCEKGPRIHISKADNATELCVGYLLERKSDLKDALRKYLKLMKTQGTPVHRLRSDKFSHPC